jgi:hypothetical protein
MAPFYTFAAGKESWGLECRNGAKDLLAQLHRPGTGGGFSFAAVVGAGGNHPDCLRELVDRVSERLVWLEIGGLSHRCALPVIASAIAILRQ